MVASLALTIHVPRYALFDLGFYSTTPSMNSNAGISTLRWNMFELKLDSTPDLSWKWKDEVELRNWVGKGIFTETQASDFRKYGLDAVSRISSRTSPFTEEWKNWKPDP